MTTCRTCRFFHLFAGSDERGSCQRFPPQPLVWVCGDQGNVIYHETYFPTTNRQEVCGEWRKGKAVKP